MLLRHTGPNNLLVLLVCPVVNEHGGKERRCDIGSRSERASVSVEERLGEQARGDFCAHGREGVGDDAHLREAGEVAKVQHFCGLDTEKVGSKWIGGEEGERRWRGEEGEGEVIGGDEAANSSRVDSKVLGGSVEAFCWSAAAHLCG